jgi:hypothetical protein
MKAEHEDRIRRAGAQVSTTEITGTFDIEAVDAESVTGADISSPTRLNGAHFKVRGRNVGHVTGVRVDVRG